MFTQVGEQLFEDRSLVDGLRGCTGFDELFLDDGAHACSLGVVGLALGGDRVAFGVDVGTGIHLPGGRDTQIRNGDLRSCCCVVGHVPGRPFLFR
nr:MULTISPECIES: hypothetical protein [Mycobacteriales]